VHPTLLFRNIKIAYVSSNDKIWSRRADALSSNFITIVNKQSSTWASDERADLSQEGTAYF
jgi:hypothetical protein